MVISMETKQFLAHISDDGLKRKQSVKEHLDGTAELAESFLDFEGKLAKFAHAAAMLHDVGKFSDKFQRILIYKEVK